LAIYFGQKTNFFLITLDGQAEKYFKTAYLSACALSLSIPAQFGKKDAIN